MSQVPVGRADIQSLISHIRQGADHRMQGEPEDRALLLERRERLERVDLHTLRLRELISRQEEESLKIEACEAAIRRQRESRGQIWERLQRPLCRQTQEGSGPALAVEDGARAGSCLGTASEVAAIGSAPPEFPYYGPLKRFVARIAARIVLFLAGILTAHQRLFNVSVLAAVDAILSSLEDANLARLRADAALLEVDEQATRSRLDALDRDVRIEELREIVAGLCGKHETWRKHVETLEATLSAVGEASAAEGAAQAEWRRRLDALEARLVMAESTVAEELKARASMLEDRAQSLEGLMADRLAAIDADRTTRANEARVLISRMDHLRVDVSSQEQRLNLLLEEARRRLPEPLDRRQLEVFSQEADHLLDNLYALYAAFEDRFRGSRQEIKNRAGLYLKYVEEVEAHAPGALAVDIGCGRGEWLELLQEGRFHALGVDLNRVFVRSCRDRGLDVVEGDGLRYLREQRDASLGVVTAFHVLEHLPMKEILGILGETLRVLRAGGVAIFETPNPENLIVGASYFHCDPTHLKPLHPQTLKFLAEQCGFVSVEVAGQREFRPGGSLESIDLNEPLAGKINPLIDIITNHFLAPWDYAVIARKVR